MVPYVHDAGAFFAYIVRGRATLGLARAYIATTAYLALCCRPPPAPWASSPRAVPTPCSASTCVVGPAVLGLIGVFALGYRRITLAARVLGVALVLELVVILVLDIAIVAQQGLGSSADELVRAPARSLTPLSSASASILPFSCSAGLRGHRDLCRGGPRPRRTMPRATYCRWPSSECSSS